VLGVYRRDIAVVAIKLRSRLRERTADGGTELSIRFGKRTLGNVRPVDDDMTTRLYDFVRRSTRISDTCPCPWRIRFSVDRNGESRCDYEVRSFLGLIALKIHDVSYRGRLEPMGACVRRSVSVIGGCRVLPTTDGVGGSVLVDQCRLNGHQILERRRRQ